MGIINNRNCKFSTKDMIFVASIVGAIIVASFCQKDGVYEQINTTNTTK